MIEIVENGFESLLLRSFGKKIVTHSLLIVTNILLDKRFIKDEFIFRYLNLLLLHSLFKNKSISLNTKKSIKKTRNSKTKLEIQKLELQIQKLEIQINLKV